MTSPIEETPDGMLNGLGGIAAWGAKTQEEYETERVGMITDRTENISLFSLGANLVSQMVNQIADILSGLIVTPINDIIQGVKDWFSGLGDQFTAATNNAVSSVTSGLSAVGSSLVDIASTILGIQSVGVENSTSIAAINAALGGESGSGVYFVDTFDRADSASLGSDWTTVDPSGSDILISSNQAVSGNTNPGSAFAGCNTVTLGDDMSVAVVIGSILEGAGHETGIHVRMNTAQTAWVYLNIFKSKVYLGRATRSGTSVTYTDWVSVTSGISVTNGTQVELRAVGSTYRAFVGGIQVAAYTDAAVSHPVGASYRTTGFRVEYDDTPIVGGRSPALGSFAMADITVPDTLGTGWNLYRGTTSSSTSTTWTSSGTALGSDCFTVEERKAGVTVDSLGLGRIKILKAGWYSVSATYCASSDKLLAGAALLGGTSTGAMTMIRTGQRTPAADGDNFMSASWTVYCPVNYYLQAAGYISASTGVQLIGNTSGSRTNFTGALLS